jgi:hypothetical protein
MALSEADTVAALLTGRDDLIAALIADAANPKLDYNIDGQAVNRSSWRRNLVEQVKLFNEMIIMFQPFESQTFILP